MLLVTAFGVDPARVLAQLAAAQPLEQFIGAKQQEREKRGAGRGALWGGGLCVEEVGALFGNFSVVWLEFFEASRRHAEASQVVRFYRLLRSCASSMRGAGKQPAALCCTLSRMHTSVAGVPAFHIHQPYMPYSISTVIGIVYQYCQYRNPALPSGGC